MSRDLNLLSANFKPKVELFLAEAKKQGLDIFITDAFRTVKEQQALYAKGRTTSGKTVTSFDGVNKKSNHQSGQAIDIAFNKPELYPKDMNLWNKLGEIAKQCSINWGYAMWKWDKPHFENSFKTIIMTPEQKQLNETVIYANKTAWNFGNEEQKKLAAKHAQEWRELNDK